MPIQHIESLAGTLFPAGICSAPPYFHDLFRQMYGKPQTVLSERIDGILRERGRAFLQNRPKTGAELQEFMCDLLAAYKCSEDKQHSEVLAEIKKYDSLTNGRNVVTAFSFCEMLSSVEKPQRETINFITTHNMYNTLARRDLKITVREFCEGARFFLGIPIQYSDNIANEQIAAVYFHKDQKSDGNNVFIHSFSFLARSRYGKTLLFFLYSQLLDVIFYTEKTSQENENSYNKRRLNAVFLLAFLIGSNPPLFNHTGGAFVTDAMLQILLVSAGFTPVQKNFLSLTEIELLFAFGQPTQKSWDSVQAHYLAACQGKTNVLFHPQSAGSRGLLHFLERPYYQTLIFSNENNTHEYFGKQINRSPIDDIKPEQGNPSLHYQKCYAALKFTLQLFSDDFEFINATPQNAKLLTIIENHFGLSIKNDGYLLRTLLACDKLNDTQRESILDTIDKGRFKKDYTDNPFHKYNRTQINIIALEIEYHFNHFGTRIERLVLLLRRAIEIVGIEYALDILNKSPIKEKQFQNRILENALFHPILNSRNAVHIMVQHSPRHLSELITLAQIHENTRNLLSAVLPTQDDDGSTTAYLIARYARDQFLRIIALAHQYENIRNALSAAWAIQNHEGNTLSHIIAHFSDSEFVKVIALAHQHENICKAFSTTLPVKDKIGWTAMHDIALFIKSTGLIALFKLAKSNAMLRSAIGSSLHLQDNCGRRALNVIMYITIEAIESLLLLTADQKILLAFTYSFMQLNNDNDKNEEDEESKDERKFLQGLPFYFMLLTHFNNFYIAHTQHLLISNPNNKLLQQLNEALKIPGFFINLIENKINLSKEIVIFLLKITKIPTNPMILSEPPTFVSPIYRLFTCRQPELSHYLPRMLDEAREKSVNSSESDGSTQNSIRDLVQIKQY